MRISDWSSDVCSADLLAVGQGRHLVFAGARIRPVAAAPPADRVQSGRAERDGRERHGNDGRGYRRHLHAAVFRRAAAVCLCRASPGRGLAQSGRSEEHTSELQSLMRISYAVFCLKKKTKRTTRHTQKRYNTPNKTNPEN